MDAQRHGLARRQAEVLARQPLLVHAVARLVQDAEERVAEVALVVARGDAHVARPGAAAERVGRHVEPARVVVEADRRGDLLAERFLHVDGKLALQHRRRPAGGRCRRSACDQRRQRIAQPGEHAGHLRRRRVRLVVVEQRIVGRRRVAERRRLLPLQLEHLLQQRPEHREVVGLAGLDPHLLAERRGARQLLDERLRQPGLLVVLPPQLADDRAGVAVRIGRQRRVGQLGEPLADPRVGLPLVNFPGQKRHLLGPIRPGGRRHLGPLVPLQQPANARQQGRLAGVGAQSFDRLANALSP